MLSLIWLLLVAVGAIALAYGNASGRAWVFAIVAALAVAWAIPALPFALRAVLTGIFIVGAIALALPDVRRRLFSDRALSGFRRLMPLMSPTERDALDAGTVGWDGELFSGRPDWGKLLAIAAPSLTAEEQRFLDEDVEALCAMVTEWETTNVYGDLPPRVWQFIKDRGFLGMIIPKVFGGLGFSAFAHSQVITKLSTRSSTVTVTVLVPNSLGPGELLLNYGTDEQKRYYLPRLARGVDLPCFALTNPNAGSDAASIPDFGIVCHGEHEGRRVVGLRVTWDKRYITLGPVATLLGLAFRAFDPDRLLGGEEDLGITCALIPTTHPGVVIGRRHMPLNAAFQNGPNSGCDVFIPLDWVIGGQPMIGRGWRMLMECLAAGRGISLPSSNTGMAKLVVRTTGGYARVRRQFKTPIGRFEGIEEPLARMGGNLYVMDATRILTAAAVDLGEKPAVLSSIAKLHLTERNREIINDAMDIAGGKGICLGPANFLASAYMQMPVSITVEGANILTRSLIVFGQGAIRSHPYVLREIDAARESNRSKSSVAFDAALFGHVRFTLANFARTLVMGVTRSRFGRVPDAVAPEARRYYQHLTHFSAALAFLTDISLATMGGALKRREKLSARLGDILSMLYLSSATLKRYESENRQAADAPLMHWAIQDALFKAQNAFEGVMANFPNRVTAALLRWIVFPLGRPHVVPSDRLGHEVARILITPSAARDRLTADMFFSQDTDDPVAAIERALSATLVAEPIEARLNAAIKAGRVAGDVAPGAGIEVIADRGVAAGVLTEEERQSLVAQRALVGQVIRVDDFDQDLRASSRKPATETAPPSVSKAKHRAAA